MKRTLLFPVLLLALTACGAVAEDIFASRPLNQSGNPDGSTSNETGSSVPPTCSTLGGPVQLFQGGGLAITQLAVNGPRVFALVESSGLPARIVRFNLQTMAEEPLAVEPKFGSFGLDSTNLYFADVIGGHTRVVRGRQDGNTFTETTQQFLPQAALVFAPKVTSGAVYVSDVQWTRWKADGEEGATLSQGGVGEALAVAAGPDGEPFAVMKEKDTPDVDKELVVMPTLTGGPIELTSGFTALARGSDGFYVGTTPPPSLMHYADGATSADASLILGAVDDGRVGAIATTDDGILWTQGDPTQTAPCSTGKYAVHYIRQRALPLGAMSGITEVARVISSFDCAPPAIAVDACNVYWADGDNVMARPR